MPDSAALTRRLSKGLDTLDIEIDDVAIGRLVTFVELMCRWNRVHNLTAVRDPLEIVDRHLIDSVRLLPLLGRLDHEGGGARLDADVDLLDVGSGAGLPSIPLAICAPGWRVCSVETNGKKARFQRQVAIALRLDKLDVRQARIEEVALSARVLVARAFAAPVRVLEIASRHVVSSGHAILMPGRTSRVPDPLPSGWALSASERDATTGGGIVACRRVGPRGG